MKFSILITAKPGADTDSALSFCHALLNAGHSLYRIFFYGDGTLCGHTKEPQLPHWRSLSQQHGVDLVLCSTSAQKRGIFDGFDAEPEEINGLAVSGLGQLVDATVQSDRVVTFS